MVTETSFLFLEEVYRVEVMGDVNLICQEKAGYEKRRRTFEA